MKPGNGRRVKRASNDTVDAAVRVGYRDVGDKRSRRRVVLDPSDVVRRQSVDADNGSVVVQVLDVDDDAGVCWKDTAAAAGRG